MNLKAAVIFLTTVVALAGGAAAQDSVYAVFGSVTDENGEGIPGATVFLTSAAADTARARDGFLATTYDLYAVTDLEGRFRIGDVASGAYAVSTFITGKRFATKRVNVDDADVQVNFELSLLQMDLGEVLVRDESSGPFGIARLRPVDVEGVAIYEAKKSEVVIVDDMTANLAANNSRQIYGKVPGLNIWESDGASVQLGLGGRGLSPNRNSNFNTRQNGYDIAADALGYPESYYTPPAQALERIEIVRGAASLQYGTQFGGLLNFVFKDGPERQPVEITVNESVGSFGLVNTFNSIGLDQGPVRAYGFYQYRRSDGWRPNADLDQHTAYLSTTVQLTPRLSIRPEYTFMHYLAQQPGGLTDTQFERDPRSSTRARNWFRVDWNLFALRADYRLSSRTTLNTRFFGLVAGRDALGNLGRIDRIDHGGPRDLLKDDFRNWGNETRIIHRYALRDDLSVLLVGTRYYDGFTHRRQGLGPAGERPGFDYLNPDNLEGSAFDLPSRNLAVFAENVFNVTPRFSVTPGVRLEHIRTAADGTYRNTVRDLAGNVLLDERIDEERSRQRSFMFFGLGLSYKASPLAEVYANISQNYRAINFNDIRVDIGSLEVDPDITDERGFNADLGVRGGRDAVFTYDVSLFHLSYSDRIGTLLRTEPNPTFNNLVDRTFRYRTNIADARIRGLETFAEIDLYEALAPGDAAPRISLFSNLAILSARYINADGRGVEGNRVELVPRVNLKTGLTIAYSPIEITGQFTHVSEQFSDASNARRTPSAIEGIIPSYQVLDLSARVEVGRVRFETGSSNLTDRMYFTRRATGYPGPGIIPAVGRSVYLTVAATL